MNERKNRLILIIIVALMLSNIILAILLFTSHEEGKDREAAAMAIYKEIGLTPTQIDTFKAKKDVFFSEMKPLWENIKELKNTLYKHMDKASTQDSLIQSLTSQIAEKNKEADLKMYQHFIDIRALCTPEQKIRFDSVIPKFINRDRKRER
jgi:hypothetical protein